MILVADRTTLAAALARVAGIVDKKNTIPILSNVLLNAENDRLTIRATNGDMKATETCECAVGVAGETTVAADTLLSFVRNLPEGSQVNMKLGERLQISAGRARMNLATLPTNSFPQAWADEWAAEFEIDGAAFSRMLGRVAYAQETNVTRTYLMGVRLESSGAHLRMIATNGQALTYCDGPEVPQFLPVTIPSRMVIEARRLASEIDGPITVGLSSGKISVSTGATSIVSKLIDASLGYPDYARVIPKTSENQGSVHVESLIGAIRRAMISATDGKRTTVKLSFAEGSMIVSAHNALSDATDEIDLEFMGEPVVLPFDPDLMIEMLSALQSETATFELGNVKQAMIWRGGDDGLTVMMPQLVA